LQAGNKRPEESDKPDLVTPPIDLHEPKQEEPEKFEPIDEETSKRLEEMGVVYDVTRIYAVSQRGGKTLSPDEVEIMVRQWNEKYRNSKGDHGLAKRLYQGYRKADEESSTPSNPRLPIEDERAPSEEFPITNPSEEFDFNAPVSEIKPDFPELTEENALRPGLGEVVPPDQPKDSLTEDQDLDQDGGAPDYKDLQNRIRREKISRTKLLLASKAASFLENIPTIKFVGITGSLAMNNAEEASDIDLMLITKNRTLWTTRGIVLVFLKLFGFKLRRAGQKEEKDKLCLNLWLDEGDLEWKDRNEFTAHEIVQIKPLINKNNTFEKFLFKNKWILDYWPNAVTISRFAGSDSADSSKFNFVRSVEKLAFQFQYLYMKRKITNEIVRLTRAQFHPRKIG